MLGAAIEISSKYYIGISGRNEDNESISSHQRNNGVSEWASSAAYGICGVIGKYQAKASTSSSRAAIMA